MPLNRDLIELNPKKLIMCRECRATADVSMKDSHLELICPGCRRNLGSWLTSSEAVADLAAYVERDYRSEVGKLDG